MPFQDLSVGHKSSRLKFPVYDDGIMRAARKRKPKYPTYGPPSVSSRPKSRPPLSFGKSIGSAINDLTGHKTRPRDYKTHDELALEAVNNALSYPQVNTPTVDAGSSIMDALKGAAANILDSMGSTGDGQAREHRVAYQPQSGLLDSPVVLIGVVVGVGALIYAVNK